MGEQLTKFRRRRAARAVFEAIDRSRDKFIVLHYSCESFYDIKDGRTPRVTSIAARHFPSGQTASFSIHKAAEEQHVSLPQINSQYDNLERIMLDEYYEFIKSRHGYNFIHWNMRDINYGFQAIDHRYKVLGGVPTEIGDDRKFDLARELINRFGPGYAPHGVAGRLHSLIEMNNISGRGALTGKEEADAFDRKEYVKLHQSTLRKVDVMSNILERILDGTIKTKATWLEKNGYHPAAIVELAKEYWVLSIISFIVVAVGFAAALKDLF